MIWPMVRSLEGTNYKILALIFFFLFFSFPEEGRVLGRRIAAAIRRRNRRKQQEQQRTNSTAGSTTAVPANDIVADSPPNPNAAPHGVVCVPIKVPQPDPQDPMKTQEIEQTVCYPAPAPPTQRPFIPEGANVPMAPLQQQPQAMSSGPMAMPSTVPMSLGQSAPAMSPMPTMPQQGMPSTTVPMSMGPVYMPNTTAAPQQQSVASNVPVMAPQSAPVYMPQQDAQAELPVQSAPVYVPQMNSLPQPTIASVVPASVAPSGPVYVPNAAPA